MSWIENWVSYKTKAQRDQEAAEYNAKVFPYGIDQRDAVFSILDSLIKGRDRQMVAYNYLVIKEKLMKEDLELDGEKITEIRKSLKNTFSGSNDDFYLYIALARADLKVDKELNYPSIEELKKSASILKQI